MMSRGHLSTTNMGETRDPRLIPIHTRRLSAGGRHLLTSRVFAFLQSRMYLSIWENPATRSNWMYATQMYQLRVYVCNIDQGKVNHVTLAR